MKVNRYLLFVETKLTGNYANLQDLFYDLAVYSHGVWWLDFSIPVFFWILDLETGIEWEISISNAIKPDPEYHGKRHIILPINKWKWHVYERNKFQKMYKEKTPKEHFDCYWKVMKKQRIK